MNAPVFPAIVQAAQYSFPLPEKDLTRWAVPLSIATPVIVPLYVNWLISVAVPPAVEKKSLAELEAALSV